MPPRQAEDDGERPGPDVGIRGFSVDRRVVRSVRCRAPDEVTGSCRWGGGLLLACLSGCPGSPRSMPAREAPCHPRASAGRPRPHGRSMRPSRPARGRGRPAPARPAGPAGRRRRRSWRAPARPVDDDRQRPADAEGADAADDVAGRPFRGGGLGEDCLARPGGRRQALQVQLPIDRHEGGDQALVGQSRRAS